MKKIFLSLTIGIFVLGFTSCKNQANQQIINDKSSKESFLKQKFNVEKIDTIVFYDINEFPTFAEVGTNREINITNILNENKALQKEYFLDINTFNLTEYICIKVGNRFFDEDMIELMYKDENFEFPKDAYPMIMNNSNYISKEKFMKIYSLLSK